jgi:hypothetical protein
MSSESMPVLSGAIPAFESFMTMWEEGVRVTEKVTRNWVDAGLYWAREYYNRMDLMQAYIIAMCKSVLPLSI